MKLFRHLIIIVCLGTPLIATGDGLLTNGAKCAVAPPMSAELQLLQGTWEGMMVGDDANQKIVIKIVGSSLHFHRDANFWFDTTITLPAGKNPKQLHATIRACPPPQADSVSKIVKAFFKIEEGVLTLATMGDDAEETQKSFEVAGTRYELRKLQEGKNTEPPKTK